MKKTLEFNPKCQATCIGSLPFTDARQAVSTVFKYTKEIPFWPQLPKRDWKESMLVQFIKNFNFLYTREQSILAREDYAQSLEKFFTALISRDLDYFEVGSEYACGLNSFFDYIKQNKPRCDFLKGQITGPFTLASGIKMPGGVSLLSDAQLLDCIISGLALKAAWQIREFKRLSKRPIIFIDEPYLACFGSGFTPVNRQDVIEVINKLIERIEEPDCLVGLHCCANTDWSMILETDIDIISFDAFSYLDRFTLYPQDLERFLKRGGVIAWGIVPTAEFKESLAIDDLINKFEQGLTSLAQKGLDKNEIIIKSLITPSCGMGTLSVPAAENVLKILADLSLKLREEYKLS